MEITKHSITKAKQRFEFKDKKKAKIELKKGLENGEVIEHQNKFNFVVKYNDMYLIISGGSLKTTLTKEMYENNKEERENGNN